MHKEHPGSHDILQKPLKIALIGYGKMGKAVEAAAKSRKHTIACIIDPNEKKTQISIDDLSTVDLCIDFSTPEVVVDNIRKIAQCRKNIIVGTTGWNEHLDEIERIVKEYNIGLLYAANFSIGVNLFYQIAAQAAQLIDHFDEYDTAIHEIHHKEKLDAPSGTGLTLGHLLIEHMQRKTHLINGAQNTSTDSSALQLSSQRCGYNPGCHSVTFDSPEETITLTHQARNREGFAKGAVRAAEWLIGKQGLYTIDHMVTSLQEETVHG